MNIQFIHLSSPWKRLVTQFRLGNNSCSCLTKNESALPLHILVALSESMKSALLEDCPPLILNQMLYNAYSNAYKIFYGASFQKRRTLLQLFKRRAFF